MALDAARDLVAAEGVQALSVRAVARAIGYAPGTLYNLFRNLDDLVIAVNGETLAALAAALPPDEEGEPLARLQEMAAAYLRFSAENRALWLLLFEYAFSTTPELPAWYVDGIRALLDRVEAPIRALAPEIDRETAQRLAFGMFSAVHGVAAMLVGRGYRAFRHFDGEAVARDLVSTFVRGLAPYGGSEG